MPVYEYYCRSCAGTFERLRPMSAAAETADCPAGHPNAARTITAFATVTRGEAGVTPSFGGGCACGGSCACGGPSRN
ncbi:MAG: zinc ribbon domain-containing protein [Dehalococcoidia bacterium]